MNALKYSWMWPKISSKRDSKNLLISHCALPNNAAKMFTVHFPGNNSAYSTQIDEMEGILFQLKFHGLLPSVATQEQETWGDKY